LCPIEECSFLDIESSVVEAKDAQANIRCSDVKVIYTDCIAVITNSLIVTKYAFLKCQGIFTSNDKEYLPQRTRDIYLKWQGIFTTNDKGYLPQMTRDIYLK
jgi:hypothetical protein